MITAAGVNQFVQALITKRLYEELKAENFLWQIAGYLGSFENKLRDHQTYWGAPLMEEASGGVEALKSLFRNTSWTEPWQKLVITSARRDGYPSPGNAGSPRSRCVCRSQNSGRWTHRQL